MLAQIGGNISVTSNVTTPDAESFRRSETQIAAMIARAVTLGPEIYSYLIGQRPLVTLQV